MWLRIDRWRVLVNTVLKLQELLDCHATSFTEGFCSVESGVHMLVIVQSEHEWQRLDRGSFPGRDVSFQHCVQIISGPHSASFYLIGTEGL
jgi:predicted Rdx family selenoprotein